MTIDQMPQTWLAFYEASWSSSSATKSFMTFTESTNSIMKFIQHNQFLHDVHPAQPIPSWSSLSLPIPSWSSTVQPAQPIPSWRSLSLPIPSWSSSSATNPFMTFTKSTNFVMKFAQSTNPVMMFISGGLSTTYCVIKAHPVYKFCHEVYSVHQYCYIFS